MTMRQISKCREKRHEKKDGKKDEKKDEKKGRRRDEKKDEEKKKSALIRKKLEKGKTISEIADDLEDTEANITFLIERFCLDRN